jgi:cell division protein FtsX
VPYVGVSDVIMIAPLLVGIALLLAAFASTVSIKRYTRV